MTLTEKLDFFQELICCNHNLYLWRFSPGMELRHTNCPEELRGGYQFFLSHHTQLIREHALGAHEPFIIETFLNVLWIADFYPENNELREIFILGPVFTGNYSYQLVKQKLQGKQLSIKTEAAIIKELEGIPVISTNILYQYAIMLHYCLTGEKISYKNFRFSTQEPDPAKGADGRDAATGSDPAREADTSESPALSHNGIWASEQVLLDMVRTGNANYMDALAVSSSLSSGVRFDVKDSVRKSKNNGLVLLILVSRAAMEGGLNPDTAYTLCDYYGHRFENADNVNELSVLCQTMMDDYIQRVRETRESSGMSPAIHSCCDYIAAHITEPLSIEFLASKAGYSGYYFSRRFKLETGMSIHDYINEEKIKKARLLLSSTNKDILDISIELGFSSRNYFTDIFQKKTGISPGEYRKRNTKL